MVLSCQEDIANVPEKSILHLLRAGSTRSKHLLNLVQNLISGISSLNCDNWNSSSIWSATSVRIQTSNSSSPDSPPPPFFGAQQIYGTILHGDKQQRQQRPVEVHLLPPFPQGKKDILHDVFRRLAVMDHLKSPCTQGFIVIAE